MGKKAKRPTCETCPYWADVSGEIGEPLKPGRAGVCSRFPPVYTGEPHGDRDSLRVINQDLWHQPWTTARDTCGEHPDFPAYAAPQKSTRAATADLAAHVRSIGLTQRTLNILDDRGIETVADLVSHTNDELFSLRGVGLTSYFEIRDALDSVGLTLKSPDRRN